MVATEDTKKLWKELAPLSDEFITVTEKEAHVIIVKHFKRWMLKKQKEKRLGK
jgi:hypothetical protein